MLAQAAADRLMDRFERLEKVWERNQPHVAADVGLELRNFMASVGVDNPTLFDATPELVAQFLVAREADGTKVVHAHDCRHLGHSELQDDCGSDCAKRAAAASTRARLGTLNGIFRDQRSNARWDGVRGNPCKSTVVEKLVARIDLEQLEAAVDTKKAPLLTQEECWRLLRAVDERHQQAAREFDPLEQIRTARDKLLLVIMWLTGLRPSDATRLLSQNISVTPEGLSVHVGVTKTGKRATAARTLLLEATNTPDDPVTAWTAYLAAVSRFNLSVETGFVFKEPKLSTTTRARSWGRNTTWSHIDKRLRPYLKAAGLPESTKPHSLHGSRAKYDYETGIPMQETLHDMQWSSTSYKHYLRGRVSAPGTGPEV